LRIGRSDQSSSSHFFRRDEASKPGITSIVANEDTRPTVRYLVALSVRNSDVENPICSG